jgi:hypothetical protein
VTDLSNLVATPIADIFGEEDADQDIQVISHAEAEEAGRRSVTELFASEAQA